MNSHLLYQQNSNLGLTRVDLILSLYEKLIALLVESRAKLERKEDGAVQPLLSKARLAVAGLAVGIDRQQGELGTTFSRLYEYVLYSLTSATAESIGSALATLRSLQEAFQQVREQAVELERTGVIPPLDNEEGLTVNA